MDYENDYSYDVEDEEDTDYGDEYETPCPPCIIESADGGYTLIEFRGNSDNIRFIKGFENRAALRNFCLTRYSYDIDAAG